MDHEIPDLPQEFWEGVACFNEQRYFEAHEALETAWRNEPGRIRELYQGILQLGVAYFHIRRGNIRGALKSFDHGHNNLKLWEDRPLPIDLKGLLDQTRQAQEQLKLQIENTEKISLAIHIPYIKILK
jgi:uncharacterized protein